MSKEFVEALGHRIESFLPNRTGYTISEVELNPQFLVTRKILLGGDSVEIAGNILYTFCGILDTINDEAGGTDLRERDENSISSTLIVLKLLFEFVNRTWVSKHNESDRQRKNTNLDYSRPFNFASFYHFIPPAKLDPSILPSCIETIITLLSTQMTRKTLALVKRPPAIEEAMLIRNQSQGPTESVMTDPASTGSSSFEILFDDSIDEDEEGLTRQERHIQDIDNYCQVLLKYMAVANPPDYYNFIGSKLMVYSRNGRNVPKEMIAKYAPLFEFVFYDEVVSQGLANDMTQFLPYIKSNTWRQVVLIYYTNTIKDQCFSRPEDYLGLVNANTPLEDSCKVLFDYVSTIFENRKHLGTSSMVQAWLVILCLSDIDEFFDSPNKLKLAFNKRLRFLNDIVKESHALTNLDSFDSLIHIFYLAARLPKERSDHPVYQFCLKYLDSTYESLHKLQVSFTSKDARTLFDNLVINLNVVAVLINAEKYIPLLIQKYYQSSGNLSEMKILVKVVKGLSELKKTQVEFDSLMKRLKTSLKGMIVGATKILNQMDPTENNSVYSGGGNSKYTRRSSQTSMASRKNSLEPVSSRPESPPPGISSTRHMIDSAIDDKSVSGMTVSSSSSASTRQKLAENTEEVLSELFYIFIPVPEVYFIDLEFLQKGSSEFIYARIQKLSQDVTLPFKCALHSNNDILVDAACSLSMSLVSEEFHSELSEKDLEPVLLTNYLTSNYIIHYTSELCLQLSLTDPKFQSSFLFLNKFLENRLNHLSNKVFIKAFSELNETYRIETGTFVCHSLEKILLLSLCTHDIQFYNVAKESMRLYVKGVESMGSLLDGCYNKNLFNKFVQIMNDDSVFTGFVSLHKKFRTLMRDFAPSQTIFDVWLVIYGRWAEMLEARNNMDDENLVFRHFTGFLVSMSGSLISGEFLADNSLERDRVYECVYNFFEKCIMLLTSNDLVIRVIVKDALSNESHPTVYQLTCTKLIDIIRNYLDDKVVDTEERILFIEQVLAVMTSMIAVKNEGSFILVALLPTISELIIRFVNKVQDLSATLRLKIRFCKLGTIIESDKERVGLRGAFRLRNGIARATLEWLSQAVFYDEAIEEQIHDENSSIAASSLKSIDDGSYETRPGRRANKEMETMYLNVDLATESSKSLSLQLENLSLEIAEGTKDKDVKKAKDIAFTNYFSILYKILQKYSTDSHSVKSKYKIHLVTENILRCITNILQVDTDIGMQFVLPLGFHENEKIRAIFLNVFAEMFAKRKYTEEKLEFPDGICFEFTEFDDICGAAAKVASTNEHNLLASSLFAVFGHTKRLDKLIHTLLYDEIDLVSRSSDIFRRNSTLTRLLSNFARDYGSKYLEQTLGSFIRELNEENVILEVEKVSNSDEKSDIDDKDADLFVKYLRKLVTAISESTEFAPKSFKFICREIYSCVKSKNEDDSIIAVGSYLFLRFLCPSIVSSDVFLNIPVPNPKVKRTLMQLVKVIQNIANGSISSLKWPRLANKQDELMEFNGMIFEFLRKFSRADTCEVGSTIEEYPFDQVEQPPLAEFRYLHKFFYHYFVNIKSKYIFCDLSDNKGLTRRIDRFRKMDKILSILGQPKSLVALQLIPTIKNNDLGSNPNFVDFMSKSALKYGDIPTDVPLVHTTIFEDGTPTVVVNFEPLYYTYNNDEELLLYRMFETCLQVWDNKFYVVYDLTESEVTSAMCENFIVLLKVFAPEQFLKNCVKFYYFNIPLFKTNEVMMSIRYIRSGDHSSHRGKIYTFGLTDKPDTMSSLGLSSSTMSILHDARVSFHENMLFDTELGRFVPVTLKIGRKFIQVCSEERFSYEEKLCETNAFYPNLVKKLTEVVKCESSPDDSDAGDSEFTIYFRDSHPLILRTPKKSEILRFLYFATSGQQHDFYGEEQKETLDTTTVPLLWFCRLYNTVFQSLLSTNEDVRSSAAFLFAALSSYFGLDMGISCLHAKNIAFPTNTTEFIVNTSRQLADLKPELTYRFFRAFFDYYDKLPKEHRVSAIMYISPWIDNVCEYIYLADRERGPSRTVDIIRSLCRISAMDRHSIPYINDYIWKKLFGEGRLTMVLVDEIVAFAIDNRNEGPEWSFVIAVVSPSMDVCGELISRLITAVGDSNHEGSIVAAQSKAVEISVLIKICSAIFFDSYSYSTMYLADVFFFCALLVSHSSIDVGTDLQRLAINTVQSFLHKPDLSEEEEQIINKTLHYLSGQRAHLLFGLSRETQSKDASQIFNRATAFEILCEHLYEFSTVMGTNSNNLAKWRSSWSTRAISIAFTKSSVYQSRAILIVGFLSKAGVSDSLASRVLRLTSREKIDSLTTFTSQVVSVSRLSEGLNEKSVLPQFLVWPQLCLAIMDNIVLYPPAINTLTNTLSNVCSDLQGTTCAAKIFSTRSYLEPYISDFEAGENVRFTVGNLSTYVFVVLCKGLKIPSIKHISLDCLKKFVVNRVKSGANQSSLCLQSFFSFVYFSSSEPSFAAYCEEIGFNYTPGKSPENVLEFFLSNTDDAKFTLILAAYFYKSDSVDNVFKSNFLNLYRELFYKDKNVAYLVYHILRTPFEQTLLNNNSIEIVENVAEILMSVIKDKTYCSETSSTQVEELLVTNNLTCLRHCNLSKIPDTSKTMFTSVRYLQEMVYRAACSYVEGQQLED
ncbi:hypothetical protein CAAN3_17S00804 [[Candida] anglica]